MGEYLDVTGGSGKHYRYMAAQAQLSPMGGNFLLVRDLPEGRWEIVYAGEAENLSRGVQAQRDEAAAVHGPLQLYTRLNVSKAIRLGEQEDVVAAYEPLMNRAPAE